MKFREGKDQDFHRLLRTKVAAYFEANGLNRFGGRTMIVKGIVYPLITAALYALILGNRLSGVPLLITVFLFGISGILTAFNLAHDAAHNSLTPSRRLNAAVYFLTFNLQGANGYLWKLRHVGSHHVFPNVEGGDADMDDNGLLRMSEGTPWRPRYRYQHLYAPLLYMLFSLHWILFYDFRFLGKKELANLRNIRHSWKEVACLILAKATYFTLMIVVPMLVLNVSWPMVILGFVLMHLVVSLVFVYSLVGTHLCEETAFPAQDGSGVVGGSWASHQLATSLDYCPTSRLANILLGGFNCHAAHHLFPEVSHVHYVAISKIIKETTAELGLRYNELSYPAMIRSHFRFLKRMGTEPKPLAVESVDNTPRGSYARGAVMQRSG